MSQQIEHFCYGRTNFMGIHGKMVSDRVLMTGLVMRLDPGAKTKTYLYDLEKLLWAIHAPNGKPVQQLH